MKEIKEANIVFGPEVLAEMEKDPKLADAMRGMAAAFRQAAHGVQTGQYDNFEDAVESITGQRPKRVNENGEECDDDF